MKKLFFIAPKFIRRLAVHAIEYYWFIKSKTATRVVVYGAKRKDTVIKATKEDAQIVPEPEPIQNSKKNLLIYHISGLGFGGTEKFLQAIAKNISKEKFNVFFLTGNQIGTEFNEGRKSVLKDQGINFLTFDYDTVDGVHPYIIHGSKPTFEGLVIAKKIDVILTATAGHTIFPINMVKDIPITLINIFGSFTVQKNIKQIIHISKEVEERSNKVSNSKIGHVIYIPSEKPLEASEEAKALRLKFNIPADAFVFGRIGRPSNEIFDPIALDAFKTLQMQYPDIAGKCYYLIMAPAPLAKQKVLYENIPNVYFIDPSPHEIDVFAFHQAIDCLAHARLDGETSGLNISESMLCGNPILTHRSHIWNAHLEYLDPSFSRIASKGNSQAYANNMNEFATIFFNDQATWQAMRNRSFEVGNSLFLMSTNIAKIEQIIETSMNS